MLLTLTLAELLQLATIQEGSQQPRATKGRLYREVVAEIKRLGRPLTLTFEESPMVSFEVNQNQIQGKSFEVSAALRR